MQQQIDQHRIGRDRGERDPQDRLGAVDRAHEAADGDKPQCGQDAPCQAEQILLGEMGGCRRLAQHQQDLLAAERKRHHRQRYQERSPQADAERAPDQMRIARAECLRRQGGYGRYQPHAKGETDKEHGMRQRGRSHGLAAEAADQGDIGRHHRDLPKLGQRDRHRKLQRLGELKREMTSGHRPGGGRRDRCGFDFFEHCN